MKSMKRNYGRLWIIMIIIWMCGLRCSQFSLSPETSNPHDHPPVMSNLSDTTVSIKDTVVIRPKAKDTNGSIKKFLWSADSGNTWTGSSANGISFFWSIEDTGVMVIFVKAVDNDGIESETDSFTMTVKTYPPSVILSADTFVNITGNVTFKAEGLDSNGTIERYRWVLYKNGDDKPLIDSLIRLSGPSSLKVTFSDTGRYYLSVVAIDDDGLSSAANEKRVHVYISTPYLSLGPDITISIDRQPTTITALAGDADGTVKKYFWSFDGNTFSDTTTEPLIRKSFTDTGTYRVIARCIDDSGETSGPDTITVSVINGEPPVVSMMDDLTVNINQSTVITATATDTVNEIERYYWAFDGIHYSDSTTAGRIEKTFSDSGWYVVRVYVRSDKGYNSLPDSVKIHVVINPPTVSVPDEVSVKINHAVTVNAVATDPDGSIARYYWAVDKKNFTDSTVINSFSATFTTLGRHVIYVKVCDNSGIISAIDSSVVTVTNGEPPVLAARALISVMVDKPVTLMVNGTDADGSIVRYLWAKDGLNYLDSTVTGELSMTFSTIGVDTVLVRAVDNDGNYSNIFPFKVTVSPTPPPVVTATADFSVDPRKNIAITATATTSEGTIAGFIWALDGINYRDTTKTGSITTAFTTGGKHTVLVCACNTFGSYSQPDSVIITVNAKSPTVSFEKEIYIIYTNVDSLLDITVTANDSDGTVINYLWSIDNKNFGDTTTVPTCSLKVTGTGSSVLYVKVMDNDSTFSPVDSTVVARREWNPPGNEIAYDTSITDSISFNGEQDAYHFNGIEGQHVTLRVIPGTDYVTPRIELYGPAGTVDTAHAIYRGQANLIDYTLKSTGTYTVFISENEGDAKLSYSFSLQCREHLVETATAISYDTQISDSISPVGDIDGYSFSGTAGQHISVRVIPGTDYVAPRIDLISPSGTVDTAYAIYRGQANILDYPLKSTGTYTILVSENEGDAKLSYSFSLQCREHLMETATAIDFDTEINDSISPVGDIDGFSFEGTAGDLLTIHVIPGTDYVNAKIELLDTEGMIDTSKSVYRGQVSLVDYPLKSTGIYRVLVSEFEGDARFSYSLSLTKK